jgi:hypothetical protein
VNQWSRISDGNVDKIYASGSSVWLTQASTGDVYQYNGSPYSWKRIGGPGGQFAAGGGHLYALSPDYGMVLMWTGSQWTAIGGAAQHIYAGGLGLFATDPISGDIYLYSGSAYVWSKVGGAGATFAVSNTTLYGLSSDGSGVYQWTGAQDWAQVGGAATRIFAGGADLFATAPSGVVGVGDLYHYNSIPFNWTDTTKVGCLVVAETNTASYCVNDAGVYRWNGGSNTWTRIGGPAANLAAGS